MNILTTTILALLLTSANALQAACPDLTGDYSCRSEKHNYDNVNISQSVDGDGITTYGVSFKTVHGNIQGETWVTDGMERNYGDLRISIGCGADNTVRIHVTRSDKYIIRDTFGLTARGGLEFKSVRKNLKTGKVENDTTICHPQPM